MSAYAEHPEDPKERDQRLRNRCSASKGGEVCGIDSCSVPPEMVCYSCDLWYCVKHVETHYKKYISHRSVVRE